MSKVTLEQLIEAGCHFGHLRRKWNPKMAPYIFMEQNGVHIIDLRKTLAKIEESGEILKALARAGKKILFVGTKKQAKDIIAEAAKSVRMPYVVERWPGGLLTNFVTIRKTIKRMQAIDKMLNDPAFFNISKRERLQITRERAKLERDFGSIADMTRLPSAVFIVDILKEHIAVKEARILGLTTFAIVDTNSDPTIVDYPIPANDDAGKSIEIILKAVTEYIKEGLQEQALTSEADKEEHDSMMDESTPLQIDRMDEEEGTATSRKRKRITAKPGKGNIRKINIEPAE
ncbi:MAG: 30S ribosomal protein S2 [Bacteroidales bacterium]|nr:30S ribosomal protein S2 [Bacteroidales bacterium]